MNNEELLDYAQVQYKFALAISTANASSELPELSYLDWFSYGPHTFNRSQLALTREQEAIAATLLVHSATYLCAVQADTVLQDICPDRLGMPSPIILLHLFGKRCFWQV